MIISEIIRNWESDSEINRINLTEESLKTPRLHAKYIRLLTEERLVYEKLRSEHQEMVLLRTLYYQCELNQETLKEKGWSPFQLKILKSDRDMYIDGDKFLHSTRTRVQIQKEKLLLLEDIMKSIHNRNYVIKNAIDWEKFTSGG